MKKTKKILSIILAILMVVTMIPMAVLPASAAETPIYGIFSGQKQILANGTNLYIEAGSTSGTSVYYMNGSKKTYVNPNGAKGDDLSDTNVFMGTDSYNDDYFDVTLIMSGGEVGAIYTGKPVGYLIGKVTIAVIGTAKVGFIRCGSDFAGTSDMHGAAGRLAIFDTVGVQIKSGFTNVDGMIRRTESGWSVSGSAAIPEGVTMTVDPGQTVTVPADSYIENNGALVNNGTLELYGAVTGNSITGNGTVNCHTAYIENVSSVSSISAKINGETVLLPNGQYRVLDGKLYIWLPDGNARVTLNSVNYYGIVSRGEELELTTAYTAPNDISGIPTEMIAYVSEPLSPKTNPTTFDPDLTFEVLASGTTAEGARIDGSSLYASGAGTIKLKVTANDGYTSYSKTFDVTVKNTGYVASIANGNIVISKHSDTQIKITHAGFSGGSLIIDKDEVLLITGTSDAEKDYGITVESGTVKVILKDVSITRSNSKYEQPLRINSGVTLRLSPVGTNSLIYNQTKASSSDKTNAGIHLPEGAKLIIDGEGSLDVQGGRGSDGIGTSSSVAAGILIINSGTVTSVSGSSGSGIRGNVTINGGTVTATGYDKGVGIGGDITINDGTVTATGGGRGAGIGGEQECAGGNITINGGTVTATGSDGAGIGGGYLGAGGNITINGGTVTATGSD
ncbi:MAG: carbohydrate-binding domain-containing protein, partial [Ruminococcaceae bacterium]|nr:carbohydrate-binding domain-containing protein [Oscillospiraceae bacterium]